MKKLIKNWVLKPIVILICSVATVPALAVLAGLYVLFAIGCLAGSFIAALASDLYERKFIDI